MPKKRLKQIFNGLSMEGKLVFVGSVLLLASVFMPWYEDLDAFHMGDMFLGITGPLYLVGFVILLISGTSLVSIVSDALDKKLEKLPLEKPHLNILIGTSSLFMLLLSSSVYFHDKFGVNITIKEMRFGMIAAFIGAILITVGGFLQNKKKGVRFDEVEGKIEPLIQMTADRPHVSPEHYSVSQPVHDEQSKIPVSNQDDKQIYS